MTHIPSVKEHVVFRRIYDEIQDFKSESGALGHNPDDGLVQFEKHVSEHFFLNLKPFWEYSLEECVDPEDRRYPNDEWLASIVETYNMGLYREAFNHGDILLDQLREAWNWADDPDFFSFDEKTKILTAYTGGWSGCEDIIYALFKAFPWIDTHFAVMEFDMSYFFRDEEAE